MVAVINNITYRTLGLLALFVSVMIGLYPVHVQAYTYDDIQKQLTGGNAQAVDWDNGCWNAMHNNRAGGQSERTSVNLGGSYADTSWLSPNGQGASGTDKVPYEVPYGTKVVNLQLNSVTFLCSALVSPDRAGADYLNTDDRVVSGGNTPNDRSPNPMGGGKSQPGINWPARTDNRFRIDSAYSTDGGAVSLHANQVLQNGRNDTSRYWFGTLPFTYKSPLPGGLTRDQTITVVVKGRPMVQYYNKEDYCIIGNGKQHNPFLYDECGQATSAFNITIKIKKSYTLTPVISTDMSGAVESGSVVNVTPSVTNSGPTTSSDTPWRVTQLVVLPGQPVPNAAGGSSPVATEPCGTYFQSLPEATCSTVASGTSVFDTDGSVLSGAPLVATPVVVGDLAIGTKVCFAFSVQPSSDSSDKWAHAAPTCLVIGKKPKLQILGGDLMSAGNVNTSTTNKSIGGAYYMFGSWIEYGIFAVRTVTGAGSGSAYAGTGMTNATFCKASFLSFTNAGSSVCPVPTGVGNYTSASPMPDVASSFPDTGSNVAGSLSPASLASGTYNATNLTLTPSVLAAGKSVILKVAGTVTIAGDQTNSNGPYTNIAQLPQLVIIADKIIINSDVTNVDAWLIANGAPGVIETCDTGSLTYNLGGGQQLTSDKCNKQLTVNGPVMANQLWLRRTAGSGAGPDHSGDPAEVFNLRPDAYLWASNRATGNGRIQTVYTTELPPRL